MADSSREPYKGRGIARGRAVGAALVSRSHISFLGDVDIRTGRVVGRSSDLHGSVVAGRVLDVPGTRGSAGAWRFLFQLRKHGTHPVAIVSRELPDPSVVQGAILAGIPIVVPLASAPLPVFADGDELEVDGDIGTVAILRK